MPKLKKAFERSVIGKEKPTRGLNDERTGARPMSSRKATRVDETPSGEPGAWQAWKPVITRPESFVNVAKSCGRPNRVGSSQTVRCVVPLVGSIGSLKNCPSARA